MVMYTLRSYTRTLQGQTPQTTAYKEAEDEGDREALLEELINVCGSMHCICPPPKGKDVCEDITSALTRQGWCAPARATVAMACAPMSWL